MKRLFIILSLISIFMIARSVKPIGTSTESSFNLNLFKFDDDKPRPLTPVEVASILMQVGFPKHTVQTFTLIAFKESSFRPWKTHKNRNKTIDYGLLQVNEIWIEHCKVTSSDLKNPFINAKCALQIYKKQGVTAWSSYAKIKGQTGVIKAKKRRSQRKKLTKI